MLNLDSIVNKAYQIYSGQQEKNPTLAVWQALPPLTGTSNSDWAEIITSCSGLLAEQGDTLGAPKVSALNIISNIVHKRVFTALAIKMARSDEIWMCPKCTKSNKARETCSVCWLSRP